MRVTVNITNYNSKFQGMSGEALRITHDSFISNPGLVVLLDGCVKPLTFGLNELRNEVLTDPPS